MAAPMARIGVDVGGTFTDLVFENEARELHFFKVPSTKDAPAIGVLEGIEAIASKAGTSMADLLRSVGLIVHGTTVATNAVLTRGGAPTAVLTTMGLRDALRMRQGIRRDPYNAKQVMPEPLVPRSMCFPVAERIDARGRVRVDLTTDELMSVVRSLPRDVSSIAVCFMHSYANSTHERILTEAVRVARPDAFITTSSELLPQYRFYKRLSTTTLNAYVGPIVERYLRDLVVRLTEAGFAGVLLVMQSNGGVASAELIRTQPVWTLLSGPAAAPASALLYLRPHKFEEALTLDMGGTSCDLALIQEGQPLIVPEGEIDGHVLGLPMLSIHTIGAGGGSIARLDTGGLLHMGPQSAGADPGPACYGKGGRQPTSTDASLVLGYLDADNFLGGRMRLDIQAARAAIHDRIAEPLGMSVAEAAMGMYELLNVNMVAGLREVSIAHGIDARNFPLIVAGGAGPLHACRIAQELELETVFIPRHSSVFCALGMLASDLKHDFVQTFQTGLERAKWKELDELREFMEKRGRELLARQQIGPPDVSVVVELFMRYRGQFHEVGVKVGVDEITKGDADAVAEKLHLRHQALYGYALTHALVDIVGIHTSVRGLTHSATLPPIAQRQPRHRTARTRDVYLPNQLELARVPIYLDEELVSDQDIQAPAIIDQMGSTVLIPDNCSAHVDEFGTIVITVKRVSDK